MTTYSVRCRNSSCRHRRVSAVHPDEYKREPKCPKCGKKAGWRIEQRYYNKKGPKGEPLCQCEGPQMVQREGMHFPHRTSHQYCDNNPLGFYNQARARGVAHEDIPPEYWPKERTDG